MNFSHLLGQQDTDGDDGLVLAGMTAHCTSDGAGRRVGTSERPVVLRWFADSSDRCQVLASLPKFWDAPRSPVRWDTLLEFTSLWFTDGSGNG